MATRERVWVKTWKVLVNNSGQSNMTKRARDGSGYPS